VRSSRLGIIRRTGGAASVVLVGVAILIFICQRNAPALSRSRRNLATGLIILLIANGLLLNFALHYTAHMTALSYADEEIRNPGHSCDDSWGRMLFAAREFRTLRVTNIYDHLLGEHGVKYLYPLTSLLLVDPIKNLDVLPYLNWACFWVAGLAALLVARTFSFSVRHEFEPDPRPCWDGVWIILAICFTYTFHPVVLGLLLGQLQTVISTLFAGALLCYLAGRKTLAGVLLGVACGMKPQLGFFLLWGLIRKEYRLAAGLLMTVTVLGAISVFVYGFRENLAYLGPLSYLSKHSESFFANQTVNGLIQRYLFLGSNLSWRPSSYSPFNSWVYGGTLVSSAIMALLSLVWRKPVSGQPPHHAAVDFGLAGLACTMAAPIAWFHHYGLLLPVFALVVPILVRLRDYSGLVITGVAFVLTSNCFMATNYFASTHMNVLQSYMFFGATLFFIQLLWLRHKLSHAPQRPGGKA